MGRIRWWRVFAVKDAFGWGGVETAELKAGCISLDVGIRALFRSSIFRFQISMHQGACFSPLSQLCVRMKQELGIPSEKSNFGSIVI